ncbi:hypothetical protein AB6A40_004793 [Gnathostoma spinigerum]|uniref:Uncharacterized protein n=1 Tax=Gnathostoma spinigerum TaxID=75299 RepID=A0ABD6EIX1_9BILA
MNLSFPCRSKSADSFVGCSSHKSNSTNSSDRLAVTLSQVSDATKFAFADLVASILRTEFSDPELCDSEFREKTYDLVLSTFSFPKKTNDSLRFHLSGEGCTNDVCSLVSLIKDSCKSQNGHLTVLLGSLLQSFVATGNYDSRYRLLLRHLCAFVGFSWNCFEELEDRLTEAILSENYIEPELTSGLAAPLIAAGAGMIIGAGSAAGIATTAGAAVLGTTFGIAGAGLTGFKMHKRVGAIEEFSVEMLSEGSSLHTVLTVSGWIDSTEENAFRTHWRHLWMAQEQYTLRYESQYLNELGHAMEYFVSMAVSAAVLQTLRETVLAGIVEDVILLGAPVTASSKQWKQLSRVVGGRIVNGYCESDWLLRFLYRTMSAQFTIAGTGPVHAEGTQKIINFNLSNIVKGHLDYAQKLTQILEAVGVRVTPQSDESSNDLSHFVSVDNLTCDSHRLQKSGEDVELSKNYNGAGEDLSHEKIPKFSLDSQAESRCTNNSPSSDEDSGGSPRKCNK